MMPSLNHEGDIVTEDQAAPSWPSQPTGPASWPTTPPPAAPPKVRMWLPFAVVTVIALGAGVGIGYALPHPTATPARPTPGASTAVAATLAVNGTLELTGSGTSDITTTNDGHCHGAGGYSDIAEGAQVVISDDSGATLAIVQLGPGGGDMFSCVFPFSAQVPAGRGYYGIQVTHRGVVKESESNMRSSVSISLGN